jgi:RHS repeat-associated protein
MRDARSKTRVRSRCTGKERDAETGLDYFGARYYGSNMGRFMSADPIIITKHRFTDPQQWNLYAYVRNNPLKYTDPTGMDFNLQCKGTKDNASTCQGGHVGTTTTDANGKSTFTPTVVTSASLQDSKSGVTGTVTEGGVKITTASGTYTGQFINGTQSATLQGSGALSPFTFNITGQSSGNLLYGTFKFNGTPGQAESYMKSHGAWTYPLDVVNTYHPNTRQFRFSDPSDPGGPSIHLSLPVERQSSLGSGYGVGFDTEPSASGGPFHVDSHGTTWGHIQDVWDTLTQ